MLEIVDNGKTKIIYIGGTFNFEVGIELKEKIGEYMHHNTLFVISFKDISFINSSGIRELLDLHRILASNGIKLHLCDLSEDINELFSFTGLDNVFKIYSDETSALE